MSGLKIIKFSCKVNGKVFISKYCKEKITRFIRSCCNRDDLDKQIEIFKQKLTLRGYSENEINPQIDKALRKNRLNTLCYKKRNKQNCPPLVLATKFNPLFKQLGRRIRKHWQLIENDITAKNLFPRPPMIAYRKHKNVKEYLTSAKIIITVNN